MFDMDFRHLKTLVAIAEHKSFAAAADAIGLTQSAVSLHVKAVEDQLQTTCSTARHGRRCSIPKAQPWLRRRGKSSASVMA